MPDDLSVIGFDDIPRAVTSTPPLTTVRQPLHRMGASAVGLLLRMLDGGADGAQHLRMPVELVVRESTKPLA
ncbi:substrate-binding domain-containing protein [Microbacterium rhizophilus]|uniref:substrate-binding domain-containing protein n=1 Tax=Microbacterium rhizophilus TaxID=3138934 RepID=UPI0031EE61B1